jgi:hypothetical protein
MAIAAGTRRSSIPPASPARRLQSSGRRQSGYGTGGVPWTMKEMTEQKMFVFTIGAQLLAWSAGVVL